MRGMALQDRGAPVTALVDGRRRISSGASRSAYPSSIRKADGNWLDAVAIFEDAAVPRAMPSCTSIN